MSSRAAVALVALAVATPWRAGAQEEANIRDNLFLLEEAYNQEAGVIQHIQVLQVSPAGEGWDYALTEEWPLNGERHQLSLTVALHGGVGVASADMGDLQVSYRAQVLGPADIAWLALAPRLSLVVPMAALSDGLGLQLNLPLSMELGQSVVVHLNAGTTLRPEDRGDDGQLAPTTDLLLGVGVVFLAAHWLNALVELGYENVEALGEGNARTREGTLVASPGVRFAIDFDGGVQVVPGLAVPLALGKDAVEPSLLAYLSIEHEVW